MAEAMLIYGEVALTPMRAAALAPPHTHIGIVKSIKRRVIVACIVCCFTICACVAFDHCKLHTLFRQRFSHLCCSIPLWFAIASYVSRDDESCGICGPCDSKFGLQRTWFILRPKVRASMIFFSEPMMFCFSLWGMTTHSDVKILLEGFTLKTLVGRGGREELLG
jgi:hypothetical protein